MFNNGLSGGKKKVTEDEVVVCSIGWFPWCEYFHHNSTMLHWQCDVTERGLGKRCAQLPLGPSANRLQPTSARLQVCVSVSLLAVFGQPSPVVFHSWVLFSGGSLHQACPWKSLSGHCAGSLVYLQLSHGSRRQMGRWGHVPGNVGSARWERSSAAFLEKTRDTKMALDQHFWLWCGRWIEEEKTEVSKTNRWFK